MKKICAGILVTLFISAAVSCSMRTNEDKPNATPVELIAAANELDSLFLVAFNNGDADAIMRLHWNSPELRAYPPGETQVNGYEAVKESYIKDFTTNKGAKLEYTSTNNIPFSDVVVGHGTFKWTMPVDGAAPMEFHGRYSEVKAFKDGKMVIILDHTSVPIAPPPAETTK